MIFNKSIVQWYQSNKRDLPWRETRDPYKIWLSEIILQQTRVDQGMSYFFSFLTAYPTIIDLANASEDEVLKKWQGLGYYSRARNLHHTAQFITREWNGEFPTSYDKIVKLKGVGPYTAAAIASFAYDEPKAVIDGNVMRVLSRFFGVEQAIDSKSGEKELRQLADTHLDVLDPASYNQAIMEFGALQCVPRNPDCANCLLNEACFAYKMGLVDQLPFKEKKTKVEQLSIDYLVIERRSQIFFKQRKDKGIWQGLYDFPSVENQSQMHALGFPLAFLDAFKNETPVLVSVSGEYTHLLSHRKISAKFYHFQLSDDADFAYESGKFYSKNAWMKLGIPRLLERYLHDKGWYE